MREAVTKPRHGRIAAPTGRLSIGRNFSWLSAGRAIYAVSQWGMLTVLAKLSPAETVGEFTLAMAVSAPIVGFATLGLNHAQASDVRHEHRFGDYFGLRALSGLCALAVIAAMGPALGYGAHTALVIVLVGLARVIDLQSEIFHGLFQVRERLDYVAWSLILRGPLAVLLLALGVALTGDLAVGVMGKMAASLLVFVLYEIPLGRRLSAAPNPGLGNPAAGGRRAGANGIRPIWDFKVLLPLTWQVLPLGVVAVLVQLQMMLPRYFMVEKHGLAQLGYFGVMIYTLVGVTRMATALGTSATVSLARLYANGEGRAFVLLLAKMAGVGVLFGCMGLLATAVAGPQILTLLYSAEYARHADVFMLVMVAALIRYVSTLLGFGVTAARHFRIQVVQHTVVTAAALAASYLLVGPYGLYGAAFATLATFGTHLVTVVLINVWSVRRLRTEGAYAAPRSVTAA